MIKREYFISQMTYEIFVFYGTKGVRYAPPFAGGPDLYLLLCILIIRLTGKIPQKHYEKYK